MCVCVCKVRNTFNFRKVCHLTSLLLFLCYDVIFIVVTWLFCCCHDDVLHVIQSSRMYTVSILMSWLKRFNSSHLISSVSHCEKTLIRSKRLNKSCQPFHEIFIFFCQFSFSCLFTSNPLQSGNYCFRNNYETCQMFFENLEDKFLRYYMHSDVVSKVK